MGVFCCRLLDARRTGDQVGEAAADVLVRPAAATSRELVHEIGRAAAEDFVLLDRVECASDLNSVSTSAVATLLDTVPDEAATLSIPSPPLAFTVFPLRT
jgi:hypothetical protein